VDVYRRKHIYRVFIYVNIENTQKITKEKMRMICKTHDVIKKPSTSTTNTKHKHGKHHPQAPQIKSNKAVRFY